MLFGEPFSEASLLALSLPAELYVASFFVLSAFVLDPQCVLQIMKKPSGISLRALGFLQTNGGIVLPLHRTTPALVLPLAGLTSEFGMGSGGTPPL